MPAIPNLLPTTDRVARPSQAGYDARLDELLLRLAITPETRLQIDTAPPQAPRIQLGSSDALPDEAVIVTLGDVSDGEGLFYAHRLHRDEHRNHYWRSRGIDTSVPEGGLAEGFRLLKATTRAFTDTAATPYMVVMENGELFFADGALVHRLTDIIGGGGDSTEDPGLDTRTITGLARLGRILYASVGSGAAFPAVARRSTGGTWTDLASAPQAVERLWAAKERLIASYAGAGDIGTVSELDELSGAPTILYTLPEGRRAVAVADADSAILIAETTGKVRALAPDDTGVLTERSATKVGLSDNEYPTAIASGFGVVVIGTGERTKEGGRIGRLYVADLSGSDQNFALVNIRLIRTFPTDNLAEDHSPTAICFKKASAYIAVPGLGETNLWRFQLATGGLSEDLVYAVDQDPVYDLAVINDRLVAAIATEGIFLEATTFVASGYIISPRAEFGFASDKAWRWATLKAEVPAGCFVEVFVSGRDEALTDPNHSSWTKVISAYDATALDALSPINAIEDGGIALKVEVTANAAATVSPRVESAAAIGYPLTDELIVQLPINISDRVERPYRKPFLLRGYGSFLYRDLIARRGQNVELELYREKMVIQGVLETVSQATPGRGHRSSGLLVAMAVVRGRVGTLGATGTIGPTTLGLDSLGIDLLGV